MFFFVSVYLSDETHLFIISADASLLKPLPPKHSSMMHLLAFEPITGAVGLYVLEHACKARPNRMIPRARVLFRRMSEVLLDTAVNEAAEPLLDRVVNRTDVYVLATLAVALVLWRHYAVLRMLVSRHTEK